MARSTLWVWLAALLAGCTPPLGDSHDDSDPRDSDTGVSDAARLGPETPVEALPSSGLRALSCGSKDPPSWLPAAGQVEDDPEISYRVVELDTELVERFYAVIYFPTMPFVRAYREGTPVVVVSAPSLYSRTEADPHVQAGWGLVEVQPLFPAWTIDGMTTSGSADQGGALSGQLLREVLRFAAGERQTADGLSLRQLTHGPVCDGAVALHANSSGIFAAIQALEGFPDGLGELVLGLSTFESPHVPQGATGDLGASSMDPERSVDADGNGVTWDDARKLDYEQGSCHGELCELDYGALAWSDAYTLRDLRGGLYPSVEQRGLLYYDRNASGTLDVDEDCMLDLDGDGALGVEEDLVLLPIADPGQPDRPMWYSDVALQRAVDAGVLDESDWPEHVATLDDTLEFWSRRNPMAVLPAVLAAAPVHFRVHVNFSTSDHGIAQPTRPHLVAFRDAVREAGWPARYNLAEDALDCMFDVHNLEQWNGELAWDADIAEGALDGYGIPIEFDHPSLRALGALAIPWEVYGPFDRCPRLRPGGDGG